ncbi:MAG: hypothetical protein FJX74_03375, partial [Armatimonadetes bacterium]|nr:hypothetical protein [Armatimonadota bacterium]
MCIRPITAAIGLCFVVGCDLSGADSLVAVHRDGAQAGHYLIWRGRPVLLIGDSVTQGWMEGGADFDQDAYVDALAARGINLLMLWAYKGANRDLQLRDERLGYDAPECWPWSGSPDRRDMDLLRPNDVYFHRLRALVDRAAERGLVVLITVHDGWTKTCFAGHPLNRELGNGPLTEPRQYVELADYDREMAESFSPEWEWRARNQYFQERFCARLIAELAPGPNVLYEMFNEGEWYDPEQRRRHEQHFLSFFRARCANLLVSNTDHLRGDDPHNDPKVDTVSLHPHGWVGHFPTFEKGFRDPSPRPYLYSEPVPEFDGESPPLGEVRRSLWETALAGAGWVNQNDTSFGWNPRAAIASRAAARDRAYDQAGHCARFMNDGGVRFWEMAPHGELAGTGVCLARPGEEYVVYSP